MVSIGYYLAERTSRISGSDDEPLRSCLNPVYALGLTNEATEAMADVSLAFE
jgi:hypothetical protein